MSRIYKDFDLPHKHLAGERHYVPPKARSEDEIERRRSLPRGTLLTEYQQKGLTVATLILQSLRNREDTVFASRLLAASSINSAWYSFAEHTSVMRRRLKLPILATDDPEQRPSSFMLLQAATDRTQEASQLARQLVVATERQLNEVATDKRQLGRSVGSSALTIACIDLGDQIAYDSANLSDFDVQHLARQRGLRALQDARALEADLGTPPSLAQLADPDSDLAVFWRRNAPNGALSAYEQAYEEAA